MAHLYQRKGTWWGCYSVGLYGERRRVRVSLETKSRRHAEEKLAALVVAAGSDPGKAQQPRSSFGKFLDTYRQWYVSAGGAELEQSRRNTVSADKTHLDIPARFLQDRRGRKRVAQTRLSDVEAFVIWRLDEGRSLQTVHSDRRAWRAAWNWGARRGMLPTRNPWALVEIAEAPMYEPVTYTREHVQNVLRSFETGAPEYAYLAVAVAAYAALRAGEIARLRWEDIDLERKLIAVATSRQAGRIRVTKTRRPRAVAIPDELAVILERHQRPEGPVCRSPKTRRGVNGKNLSRAVCRYQSKLGIRVTLQALRSTVADLLDQEGISATPVLGHADPRTTRRHYVGRVARANARLSYSTSATSSATQPVGASA